MIFSPKALGIDIRADGPSMAVISGKPHALVLEAHSAMPFAPGTMRFSLREENIINEAAFAAKIRECYLRLLSKVTRVSVSLPDEIGRVVLIDLETRFKTRDEGADIIRWKLKKSFPFDVNELHLDYQVMQERESGEVSTLVSLVSRQVITQYEKVLAEAGLQPSRIDFRTFNICRLFSSRLEMAENAALMIWNAHTLSVLVFSNGVLDFVRSKELPGEATEFNRVYREISSSLQVYKDKQPGHAIAEVFYIAPDAESADFRAVAAEATGLEPVILDVGRIVTIGSGVGLDKSAFHTAIAALGAAVGNLR